MSASGSGLFSLPSLLDQPTGQTTCSPPVPPAVQYEVGPMLPSTYGHNFLRTAATGRLTGSGTCDSGPKAGESCFSNSDCLSPNICSGGSGVNQKFGEFQGVPGACADSNTSSCNIDVTPLSLCEPPAQVHPDHPIGFSDNANPGLFCQGDALAQNLPCTVDATCKLEVNSRGICSTGVFYYMLGVYTFAGPGGTLTHNQFDGSPALLHVARTNAGTVNIPYTFGPYLNPAAATNCP
jgi:hypothetical protein